MQAVSAVTVLREPGGWRKLAGSLRQVRFCRYRFSPTGELKYRGAEG
jgi:hypothetical protein